MEYLFDKAVTKMRKARDVAAADKIMQLKRESGSNPWPVIEECIKVWVSKHPDKWDSYLIHIDDLRKTRKDRKFASTYDKVHGGYLRYTLDIPQAIMLMIRSVYDPTELPMNKEFFHKWGKRFPKMLIPEKL